MNYYDEIVRLSDELGDIFLHGDWCAPWRPEALCILQDDDIIKTNRRCNMSKFKVGDKVKIVKGYPMTGRRKETDKAIGVVGKITKAEDPKPEAYSGAYGAYFYYVEGDNYEYDEDALELVEGAKVKDKDGKDNLRIVYKVVKAVAGGGFRSCRITDEKKLLYSLEHKTKAPKDAPIFVFSSWLHAKDFSVDGDVVLKCVGKVVDGDRFGYGAWIVPTGTLFCSWVFPIEVA